MLLYPGIGLYMRVSGLPYADPLSLSSTQIGNILVPWSDFGGVMINSDRDYPRKIRMKPFIAANDVTVEFYDIYDRRVFIDTFVLHINLLDLA